MVCQFSLGWYVCSWLEEINRRQAEMVAARVSVEKMRQRNQALTAENENLKVLAETCPALHSGLSSVVHHQAEQGLEKSTTFLMSCYRTKLFLQVSSCACIGIRITVGLPRTRLRTQNTKRGLGSLKKM